MLPKENRLRNDAEIKKLMATGKTFFLPQLTVKYKINRQTKTRVVFVVSNKVSKKATERNLLKRRLRNATKDFLSEVENNFDLAIIAKQSCLKLDYATLKKQLNFVFHKTIINKKQK